MSTESATVFAPVVTIGVPENIEALIIRAAPPRERFSDEEFAQFCAEYPDLRIEMSSEGEMIIMLPVVSEGGRRNFLLTGRFSAWVEADRTGVGFDSSAGFTLPNGAKRAPDVSWIRRERWDALSEAEKNEFAPICPDFVVELRSKSDRLATLQRKMEEYLANGASLGWLIDPLEKKVHIYRPGAPVDVLDQPSEIAGDPLLKGFVLKLDGIFN
ncbi:MAG TPA: Uma2 family endonuclease [Blastocatellia bacterium]